VSIDSTVGGASANSYVSQAAASAYFMDRLDADEWLSAPTNHQAAALIMATRRLDEERYHGCVTSTDQALQWPRAGVTDPNGFVYDSAEIPAPIQRATFELALALLKEPTLLNDSGLNAFESISIPSLDITPRSTPAAALPSYVKRLIAPLRVGGSHSHVSRA
jgi:hypothetical protein